MALVVRVRHMKPGALAYPRHPGQEGRAARAGAHGAAGAIDPGARCSNPIVVE
jgi:hypothetical protein